MGAHLHPAFDQFDGRDNKGDDQARKESILKSLQIAKFSLAPDGLVQFVWAEADRADHGSSDERVVDSAEQLHDSLVANDIGDDASHAELRLHLHVHLNCVEVVARQTPRNPWESATEEILQELLHTAQL